MAAAPPRPGPASLLSPSERPQPRRTPLVGGRAGYARSATRACHSESAPRGASLVQGPASTPRMTKQVTHVVACARMHAILCAADDVPWEGAAACIRPVPVPCLRSDDLQDNGNQQLGNSPLHATPCGSRASAFTGIAANGTTAAPSRQMAIEPLPPPGLLPPTPAAPWG